MEKFGSELIGIQSSGYEYMEVPQEQEGIVQRLDEFFKIMDFLTETANNKTIPEFQGRNKKLQFINYGHTELVYVLTIDKKKYTMLVGQPIMKFGTVKKEYENLKKLGKRSPEDVITPIQYFKDKSEHELYITPYLYQARCIGVEDKEWGMWIPEPEYHFEEFTKEERSIINSSMIALLVKLFDEKNNLGICACELGGGDFILEKGFETEKIDYNNIIKRLKLIAARELLPMTLKEYINKIREEFSQKTYYKSENERDNSIIINNKARAIMTREEIEKGIELGYELKKVKDKEIEK